MEEKIYYFSKRKHLIRVAIAGMVFIACFALVAGAVSSGSVRRIGILILVGIVGLIAAFFLLVSIPVLFGKRSKEIELSDKGIFAGGSSSLGIVPWDNISNVTKTIIENKNYICVHVYDIAPYKELIKDKKKQVMLQSNKIALLLNESNINAGFITLSREFENYFKKYGKQEPATPEIEASDSENDIGEDIKLPLLNSQIFMHYDSGIKQKKDLQDQEWVNQHVFFWTAFEPFEKKSLPAQFKEYTHRYFILRKELPKLINIGVGQAMPWFGMPGNGDKYFLSSNNTQMPIKRLIDTGHFQYIELLDKQKHIFSDLQNIFAAVNGNLLPIPQADHISLKLALAKHAIKIFKINR